VTKVSAGTSVRRLSKNEERRRLMRYAAVPECTLATKLLTIHQTMREKIPIEPESPFNESVESFRKFLGKFGDGFTDAQLPELRRQMKAAANLLLELYLRDRRAKRDAAKRRKGGFDSEPEAP
jgi:hypothetical protein